MKCLTAQPCASLGSWGVIQTPGPPPHPFPPLPTPSHNLHTHTHTLPPHVPCLQLHARAYKLLAQLSGVVMGEYRDSFHTFERYATGGRAALGLPELAR